MLKLTNVSKYYHSNEVVALGLRKVNLEFNLGEFVAVTGESGSGKSTLLNVISGLDTYEDGEMYVNEEETSYFSVEEWEGFRRQYIGFVFQNYNIIDSYSVLENVMIALIIQGYDIEKRKARALELIDKVGLSSHTHHKASKLSGGQKQRCVIARALAKDCPIIVCDEPTGNLDSESGEIIMSLLEEISKDKLVIVVTHNYDQVEAYATRKIRLFDGEVVEDKAVKKPEEVTKEIHVPTFSMSVLNLMGISLRNLWRTPRRTIFTSIVAVFTVMIFVFAYGNYTGETTGSGDFYGGGYFANVTESRIIVTKFDNTAFTQTEIDSIEDVSLVRSVVDHDVILDTTIYSYYEEYDWIGTWDHYINPATMLRSNQLEAGRLPTSKFEVVIEHIEGYEVGDTITLGWNYPREENDVYAIPNGYEFTITGIAEQANVGYWVGMMYFHEDFINTSEVFLRAYLSGGNYSPPIQTTIAFEGEQVAYMHGSAIQINDTIPNGEIHASTYILSDILVSIGLDPEGNIAQIDGYEFQIVGESSFETNVIDVEITDLYDPDEGEWSFVTMNSNTLNALLTPNRYQISALVFDQYDAEKVIEDIDALGFNTIYPSGVTDPFSAIFAIFTTIYLGITLGFLMLVIYFISYIVLRNIQNSKKKDYLIFRSIGASKKDLNRITIIELFFTSTFAYIFTMAMFIINENIDTFIPRYLRYFSVGSYILIFFMMIVLSLFLGRRFNKKLFSNSVITSLKQE